MADKPRFIRRNGHVIPIGPRASGSQQAPAKKQAPQKAMSKEDAAYHAGRKKIFRAQFSLSALSSASSRVLGMAARGGFGKNSAGVAKIAAATTFASSAVASGLGIGSIITARKGERVGQWASNIVAGAAGSVAGRLGVNSAIGSVNLASRAAHTKAARAAAGWVNNYRSVGKRPMKDVTRSFKALMKG